MGYVQDFRLSYALREGLCMYAFEDLTPTPAGAERVELSADKRVYTFRLRPGAVWSNGDPVVAGDYVFAWRRMLESPGEYSYLFYYIRNAKAYQDSFAAGGGMTFDEVGIRAVDDRTLVVTLDNPVAFFLDLVAFTPFYPMHEPSMRPFAVTDAKGRVSYRPEFTRPPHVVTNGAFNLVSWEFKKRVRAEKSRTYWDRDKVKLNSIEFVVNEDRLSQILMYESGAVDWVADVASDVAAELKQRGRDDLVVRPGFGTQYISVNTAPAVHGVRGKNPLSDVRVRQAIAMAIDKGHICENITRMGERPATTYVPPGIFRGYRTEEGLPYDPARARQLLAEAGYPNGEGCPEIPLIYNSAIPVYRDTAQAMRNQLRANLNVTLSLEGLDGQLVRQRYQEKRYAMGISKWTGDYADVSTFTDKYLSSSLNNDTNWGPAEFDRLCDEATREPDAEKRLRLLERAERIINTELPVIPLLHFVNLDWCRPYAKVRFNSRMTTVWKGIEIDRGARE
jgi:oligopeptide transport system substrate-binding protein